MINLKNLVIKEDSVRYSEFNTLNMQKTMEAYKKGDLLSKIKEDTGFTGKIEELNEIIKNYMRTFGISGSAKAQRIRNISGRTLYELHIAYNPKNDLTIEQIVKETGLSRGTVKTKIDNYCNEAGIDLEEVRMKRKKTPNKLPEKEQTKQLIVELYSQGKSFEEILSVDDVIKNFPVMSIDIIKSIIYKFNRKHPEKNIKSKRLENLPDEEIYELHTKKKYTIKKLSQIYDVDTSTICKKIATVHLFKKIQDNPDSDDLPIDKICKQYFEEYKTMEKIAEEFGLSVPDVSAIVNVINPDKVRNNKRHNNAINIDELVSKYESGISIKKLIVQYHSNYNIIYSLLRNHYKGNVPDIISEECFYSRMKSLETVQKSKSILDVNNPANLRRQIVALAKEAGTIIPTYVLDKYFGENGEEQIDINEIRKYVTHTVVNPVVSSSYDPEYEEELKKHMFNYFKIAGLLKEKNFDISYQAVALLACLKSIQAQQIEGYEIEISESKIKDFLNQNQTLLDAIDLVSNSDSTPEYNDSLKKNEVAKNVQLAVKLQELYSPETKIINWKEEYEPYYEMSKNTPFAEDFEERKTYYNSLKNTDGPSIDD